MCPFGFDLRRVAGFLGLFERRVSRPLLDDALDDLRFGLRWTARHTGLPAVLSWRPSFSSSRGGSFEPGHGSVVEAVVALVLLAVAATRLGWIRW